MEAGKWGGREEEKHHSREVWKPGKQGSEVACSRLAVSGDDQKAVQDEQQTGSSRERGSTSPLVAHPALLSNHSHWQSAWNKLVGRQGSREAGKTFLFLFNKVPWGPQG